MAPDRLSTIQLANLAMLFTIQDAARQNPSDACLTYQLGQEDLQVLCGLGLDDILQLVVCVGQISLFPPRADLASLLRSYREPKVVTLMLRAKVRPREVSP